MFLKKEVKEQLFEVLGKGGWYYISCPVSPDEISNNIETIMNNWLDEQGCSWRWIGWYKALIITLDDKTPQEIFKLEEHEHRLVGIARACVWKLERNNKEKELEKI